MEWTRKQQEAGLANHTARMRRIHSSDVPLKRHIGEEASMQAECELTAALSENERLRQPVVTATGIIMSFVAYCAGNKVPDHIIKAAKEWLKANDPSFGRGQKRWRVVDEAEQRCKQCDCLLVDNGFGGTVHLENNSFICPAPPSGEQGAAPDFPEGDNWEGDWLDPVEVQSPKGEV